MNNKNKMNQNLDTNNNLSGSNNSSNILQKKNNNSMNNPSNLVNSYALRNNKPQKKYLLSICKKINNNQTETIKNNNENIRL